MKAAILGGADAVYLGGKHFGARRLAENFTAPELNAAVALAHENGVKVYVTVNILVKERELQQAYDYLHFLDSIGIDAVIVQDRGLLRLIRENLSIPIHASTQIGIHTPCGAAWAEKNGISRIILARELSMEELRRIRQSSKIGLEVFVHGALCYSFSGQCLFSSILGGRSGNRGLCAQPCRKTYVSGKERQYWLSTADLFAIESLSDLLEIGIDGVKIEGRLRSPTYVYLASKIYSSAIKRAEKGEEPLITAREKELLEVVFNRGFTRGYLTEKSIMQREYPNSRGLLLGKAHSDGEKITTRSNLLMPGDGVTLYRGSEKIGGFEVKNIETKNGNLVLQPPFSLPKGEYQLYKTRDREFSSIQRMIDALEFPQRKGKIGHYALNLASVQRSEAKGELSFYISSLKTLRAVLPCANRVYFEWNRWFDEAASICRKKGVECVLMLPRLSFEMPEVDAESLMVCSVDQFEKYRGRKLYGYYSMNFFNSLTVPELFQYTLSVELSKRDIAEVASHYAGRLEALVFGRIELMVTRDPTLNEGVLTDARGKRFPVYRDRHGIAHILNSSDLFMLDFLDELEAMGIDSFGIDLRRRNSELSEIVARAFYKRDTSQKRLIKKRCGSITAGHYLRGVA